MLFVLFQVLRLPLINKTAESNNFLMCFDHTACIRLCKWTYGDEPDSACNALTVQFSAWPPASLHDTWYWPPTFPSCAFWR